METIFDVSNFLNKIENAFEVTIENVQIFKRVNEVLTNLFEDLNSENLKSVLKNVR